MTVLLATIGGLLCGAGLGGLVVTWADRPLRWLRSGPPRGTAGSGPSVGVVVGLARLIGPRAERWVPTPTDAARRIEAAGLSPTWRPADLRALRGAGVVVGTSLGTVVLPFTGSAGLLFVVGLPLGLSLGPDLVLGRRRSRRAAAMLRTLPDTIDLLRIALRGGRSVPEVLARVGAHQHGALGHELRRTAAEVRIGVPVERALVGLRGRCPADGAPELVALLLRAHAQGTAVADGLEALADDLRDRRARAAIDQAARAAPKIQLVVALLLVPAAMLLIAAVLLQLRVGA